MHLRFKKIYILLICLPFVLAGILFFINSKQSSKNIVIWTDQSILLSYAEFFNSSQSEYKVIVEYQESPVDSFVNAGKNFPDIVIGPWLKNEMLRKNFLPLNFAFAQEKLSKKDFYPQLLELGNINGKQYLLPVSFNLPLLAFSSNNSNFVKSDFMLSLEEIKESSKAFNKKNKKGDFTAMGFAPIWNSDFAYVASKLFGTDYTESANLFSYNELVLQGCIDYLKEWTIQNNESITKESDFQFANLCYPVYKLVNSEKCLFTYSKSDELFTLPQDRLQNVDFRWICKNNRIAMADKLIYLGIHHKTKNKKGAEAFVLWLCNEENQKQLLERSEKMKMTVSAFGIAGGFSAIKSVNEKYFPIFYPILYGHLPTAEYLSPPNILPASWEDIKNQVIVPYLADCLKQSENIEILSLEQRILDWQKQNY